MKNQTTDYPIVNDYLTKLRKIERLRTTNKANSIEVRCKLRDEAVKLTYAMTPSAYKKSIRERKKKN